MTKPQFVYVTHIASTVEAVFNALTDPEMTRNYWGRHHNASDWKVGSRWDTMGPLVKLTVTHSDLEPGSEMEQSVSFGWPIVVSSLKTLLETGSPMAGMTKRWGDPAA
jgi:uncharacterized protein YndB with AHSA1/START domain